MLCVVWRPALFEKCSWGTVGTGLFFVMRQSISKICGCCVRMHAFTASVYMMHLRDAKKRKKHDVLKRLSCVLCFGVWHLKQAVLPAHAHGVLGDKTSFCYVFIGAYACIGAYPRLFTKTRCIEAFIPWFILFLCCLPEVTCTPLCFSCFSLHLRRLPCRHRVSTPTAPRTLSAVRNSWIYILC